jgi:hypothetical protein
MQRKKPRAHRSTHPHPPFPAQHQKRPAPGAEDRLAVNLALEELEPDRALVEGDRALEVAHHQLDAADLRLVREGAHAQSWNSAYPYSPRL